MRCEDVERLLDEREDGGLDEAQERALDEHLLACPACREIADEMVEDERAVRMAVDSQPIRVGFTGEVMSRVRADVRQGRRRGAAFIGAGALTALAAVLLVFAAVRSLPSVRVLGTEGGLLRLGRGPWRSLGEGDRIEAGSWVLTFPGRRATLETAGVTLLVHGDSLLRTDRGRVDVLRGRLLVTAGPDVCRVVTPWGEVEVDDAVVAVALCYGREPVFRLDPDGRPEPRGALLLTAGLPGPRAGGTAPPPGYAEVVAIEGRVRWHEAGRRGELGPGQQIRLGPGLPAEPTVRTAPAREPWMLEPLRGPDDRRSRVRRGSDAVRALIEGLDGESPGNRLEAAIALGRLCGRKDAAEAAAERLMREEDVAVRLALLDAIRRLGRLDPATIVSDCMRDPDPSVRESALRCWIDLRGREGIEEVGGMIDDPEPWLRRLALEGLRLLADPAARPWAKLALEDPEPSVVEEAKRVLEAIGYD